MNGKRSKRSLAAACVAILFVAAAACGTVNRSLVKERGQEKKGEVTMTVSPYKVIFFDLGDTLVIAKNGWVPGAKTVISQLRAKGYRLGLISNTGDMTRDQLLAILPQDFDLSIFEENLIILSSEVGVKKPSLDIFSMAIKKANVKPSECLFCTESLLDTLAAEQVGIHVARLQKPPTSDVASIVEELENLQKLIP